MEEDACELDPPIVRGRKTLQTDCHNGSKTSYPGRGRRCRVSPL